MKKICEDIALYITKFNDCHTQLSCTPLPLTEIHCTWLLIAGKKINLCVSSACYVYICIYTCLHVIFSLPIIECFKRENQLDHTLLNSTHTLVCHHVFFVDNISLFLIRVAITRRDFARLYAKRPDEK